MPGPPGQLPTRNELLRLPRISDEARLERLEWLPSEHPHEFEAMRFEPNASGALPLFTLLHFGMWPVVEWRLAFGLVSMRELLKPSKRGEPWDPDCLPCVSPGDVAAGWVS